MMKKNLLAATAFAALFGAGSVYAAPVANWKVFNGSPTTFPDFTTDSPTIGDGTSDDADDTHLGGLIGASGSPESFTINVGETVTLSGSVVLTGAVPAEPGNFRFGLFNDNSNFASSASGWNGYLHQTDNNTYQGRTNGSFVSTGGDAAGLATVKLTTGTFDGDSTTAFDFTMAITNVDGTSVSIVSSVTGGDGNYSNTQTATDNSSPYFTYNTVGILLGGNLNVDQAAFSNVTVVIPEPGSLALLSLGGLLMSKRRRRDSI